MHELPLKAAFASALTIASGAASVISEETLIPLGLFTACTVAIVVAAVRVTVAVTRAADKMERIEERLQIVEQQLKNQGQ